MSYETNDKMVSHPDHYKSGKYEVIDIIDEFTKDLSGTEAVCTANAIKYILRWKKKNGIQDVKKAIWYLTHLVEHLENKEREEHAEFDEELFNKRKKPAEYDGSDEHCRTCKFRFETPENDEVCKNCFGRERYVCDEALVTDEIHGCDDCTFKFIDPWKEPCQSCDLHLNTPSKWEADTLATLKKLEPGCDKCEISECKFLEDPFMNPPYNELWNQWKTQKETINNLLREKKEMQDSIDILTNKENDDIEELEQTVNFQREEIKQLKTEKHEILMDLHCLICDDLNNYGDIDKNADDAVLVRKWCRRAGVDVQKIKERRFKEEDNNTGFVNGLKEANEQLAEDFNEKADNIHSCDDCVFKANEPWDDPCESCDLHLNPPSKWVSES